MEKIAQSISRIRNDLKAVKEDAFLTDRYILSVVLKYARTVIRRQDNENKIMKFHSMFEPVPCVELIEVSKVEACCIGVDAGCKIYRTKYRIPKVFEGSFGPLIREVTSLDGSIRVQRTYPTIYVDMTKSTTFKYNKSKYYWYLDGYLYFPNLEWDAISITALWEGDVTYLKCDPSKECQLMQDQPLRVPEYLLSEIEQYALNEILTGGKIPTDGSDNQQNILR